MGLDNNRFDIIIIGGGVTGCAIARDLSYYDIKVCLLEKTSFVCSGQSKANGGHIHAGFNPKPNTLKAKLNVEGNKMIPDFCSQLGVPFKRIGSLVIITDPADITILEQLLERAKLNGAPRVRIIDKAQLLKQEPNLSSNVFAALWAEDAGIVDVFLLTIALAESAIVNSCKFYFDAEVTGLIKDDKNNVIGVKSRKGKFFSKLVINCAGVDSDKIMRMAGLDYFRIAPYKGEYYVFDKNIKGLIKSSLYQKPINGGKGVAILPTIKGNLIMGGTFKIVSDRSDTSTTRDGLKEVLDSATKVAPFLKHHSHIASYAGIRAMGNTEDFLIEKPDEVGGLINVAGIASPGLTAAPAISKHVLEIIEDKFFKLKKKANPVNNYRIKPLFKDMSEGEKEEAFKKDPRYGRIICRCENVTEGDIVNAIHSLLPCTTIDAIKFRTWGGAGRCQGGFDLPRIIEIIKRETGVKIQDITKRGGNSKIIGGVI